MEALQQYVKKLNIDSAYDPIILLDIYPKELEIGIQTKICIHIFIAVLFTIALR